jgi:hypothetical protein
VPNEDRVLDAGALEQRREDGERLLMHKARGAREDGRIRAPVAAAAIHERRAAGGLGQITREIAPRRRAAEALVQKNKRRIAPSINPLDFQTHTHIEDLNAMHLFHLGPSPHSSRASHDAKGSAIDAVAMETILLYVVSSYSRAQRRRGEAVSFRNPPLRCLSTPSRPSWSKPE